MDGKKERDWKKIFFKTLIFIVVAFFLFVYVGNQLYYANSPEQKGQILGSTLRILAILFLGYWIGKKIVKKSKKK